MKIGLLFPNRALEGNGKVVKELGAAAEDLGFAHIIVYDHVMGADHRDRARPLPGPYTDADPFHEPLVLLSFLAACTRRIELATGVLILPQRQTALVAKQVAELQILSGGRVRLGVGIGWNHVEFEALGVPWEHRAQLLEEQVVLLRRLWSERLVDFAGSFHRIDRAGLLPRPDRRIPIWFGGHSDAQQARAARLGDGFFWQFASSRARHSIVTIREKAASVGRDPSSIGFDAMFDADSESLESDLGAWRTAGGTHASLVFADDCKDVFNTMGKVAAICLD
jgi:probable F420-dependent oxidoreductase